MLALGLALALQVTVQADVNTGRDSAGGSVSVGVRATRRIPVTDEHRRTAFRDPAAREMLLKAREARTRQDSSLRSYDVKSFQRLSVGMSIRETSRPRLAFRQESAARVRWQRGVGAHIEVLGGRVAAPIVAGIDDAESEMKDEIESEIGDMLAVPYYPGKDELWFMDSFEPNDSTRDDDGPVIIHPVAEGSEAYFTFATGDSLILALSDGRRITLRELIATPRYARWNLVVASIWFETEEAHIVRAAMRFSSPMDIWQVVREDEEADGDTTRQEDDVPAPVKAMLTPLRAEITAITIEYGLFDQRFWLPRTQGAEGYARASFMRIPFSVEQRYNYESVNADLNLSAFTVPVAIDSDSLRDSLRASGIDSAAVADSVRAYYARRDTLRMERRAASCATDSTYTIYQRQQNGRLPMAIAMPCDRAKLENSPDLPPSIYDSGEELFGAAERDELMRALDFGLQSAWAPQPPHMEYGVSYTRFNRIEGFGTGALVSSNLGKGYTVGLLGRVSLADLQLNGDLNVARSNGRRTIRGTLFRRLAVSSDFGDPLSFGASIPNFFYARDEGFYHRAWGLELAAESNPRGGFEWRAFSEQQWSATVENEWSLFGGAHDDRYLPNVAADKGWYHGAAARWRGGWGLDPMGWRFSTDLRLEGATGEKQYGRYFVESSVSRGLGPISASLTGALGYSSGELPAQRMFFLGGLHSVRGQLAGTAAGDAFWLGRFELGGSVVAAKPVIFADFGWAGARDAWRETGRPLSGVGIGGSFLDGLIRVDLSRGMHPAWRTRLDLYLEARF